MRGRDEKGGAFRPTAEDLRNNGIEKMDEIGLVGLSTFVEDEGEVAVKVSPRDDADSEA